MMKKWPRIVKISCICMKKARTVVEAWLRVYLRLIETKTRIRVEMYSN